MTDTDLVGFFKAVYPKGMWPAPFHILEGLQRIAAGESINRIRAADWYVLSARRAYEMLKTMFIERVYALRVRNFTRQFGGAEVDMHFSLKKELANLKELFRVLREEGPTKTASLLERDT